MVGLEKGITKEAVRMAWPAVCESFFIALAGMVDSLMVSSMGASAVAAVGLTTQPKFMGLALFFAMNVSVSALVARRRGETNQRSANVLSMVINAAQRGSGNTMIAMRTNIVSNVVNIIANYLLIQGHLGFPALGIAGAAIATVFGTVIACIMSFASLFRRDGFVSIYYIMEQQIRPALEPVISIIKLGFSVFIEQILMRVGFMSTAMMAAKMGTNALAAHQVGMNILGLTFSFGDGMQVAAVALIGRSLGEGSPDKAKAYGKTCRMIGLGISCVLAVVYFFGGEWLYHLFFAEQEIVDIGVMIIRIMIIIVLFQVSQVIYMGCLRGAGDTTYTAIASTISVTIIRTSASYFFGFVMGLGMAGIWMGILADQISRFLFASIRFKQGKWTKIHI